MLVVLEVYFVLYVVYVLQLCGCCYFEMLLVVCIEFQCDCDWIVYLIVFCWFEYKMQVFVNYEGDLFCICFMYSFEVVQIVCLVVCNLCLNEDFVEVILFVYDFGYMLFGYVGQDVLNVCMCEYGGFEYNLQSFVVVDEFEEYYGVFNGLNLCFEMCEGILKYCLCENVCKFGVFGECFLQGCQLLFEVQFVNIVDEIVYNNYDVDDGLCFGLIMIEQFVEVELWQCYYEVVFVEFLYFEGCCFVYEMVCCIINMLIVDLIDEMMCNFVCVVFVLFDDVCVVLLFVLYSLVVVVQVVVFKCFFFKNLYCYYKVMCMVSKV